MSEKWYEYNKKSEKWYKKYKKMRNGINNTKKVQSHSNFSGEGEVFKHLKIKILFSSVPPCKYNNARFTKVPLTALSDQV